MINSRGSSVIVPGQVMSHCVAYVAIRSDRMRKLSVFTEGNSATRKHRAPVRLRAPLLHTSLLTRAFLASAKAV